MVDTIRTLTALATLLADNRSGQIGAQDIRDLMVSLAQIIKEQGGQELTAGAIADTEFLRRVGTEYVGATIADGHPVLDTTEIIKNAADETKRIRFNAALITATTLRVLTMPDKDLEVDDKGDSRPPSGAAAGDLTGTYPNPGVVQSSETVAGKVELATQVETDAGTDDARAVTPLKLATAPRLPSQDENDALAGTNGTPSSANKYVTNSDPRNSDARAPTAHTHSASDVVSGTLADARISESSVTQHEAAIDHDALTNFNIGEHRVINDGGTSTTELFSASKIDSLVSAVASGVVVKEAVATTTEELGNITLSGEQTLNGLLTSASRVLVTEQTLPAENGIYVSASGAWSRAADADEDAEVTNGNITHVTGSTSTKFKFKYLLVTADPITVGTTGQSWEEHKDIDFGTTSGTATEGNDSRVPTQDENDALVGTSGAPSSANKYVTNADSRNTDARAPTAHASDHTDGTDDIQDATAAQKGVATAAQISKLDGIEAAATADQTDAEIETAYNAQVAAASQAEMEAGTEAAIRRVSPLRIAQAIAAHDYFELDADQFEIPVSGDRPASIVRLAATVADSVNAGLAVLRFDDTDEEARQFSRRIKAGALTMKLKLLWRAQAAPGDTLHDIGWKLYWREIPDGGAAPSATWAGTNDGSKVLTEIVNIADDVLFHKVEETITLLTEGILLDREYQFLLSRIAPAGTNLVGDWVVRRLAVEID